MDNVKFGELMSGSDVVPLRVRVQSLILGHAPAMWRPWSHPVTCCHSPCAWAAQHARYRVALERVSHLQAFARGPNGKWSHGNANVESASQDFAARLKRLLAHKAHYKLADFDDHCDQIDRCAASLQHACVRQMCRREASLVFVPWCCHW